MALTVNIKHKKFGEFQILNVTEIHFCYPSPGGKRIAFESDIEGDGVTYDLDDVIEFEAVEQGLHLTGGTLPDLQELSTPHHLSGLEADSIPPTRK